MKGTSEDQEAAKAVMFLAAKAAYAISLHFQPFIPFYCQKVYSQLGFAGEVDKVRWGDLSAFKPGQNLGKPEIVYRPIEKETLAVEAAKLAKK
jgi:methionyl-tRNA synthetase